MKSVDLYKRFHSIKVQSEEGLEALADLFMETILCGHALMLEIRNLKDEYESIVKAHILSFQDIEKTKSIIQNLEKLDDERKAIENLVKAIEKEMLKPVNHLCHLKKLSVKAGKYIIKYDSGSLVEITTQN